jgi:opacity protein-like surface antigen
MVRNVTSLLILLGAASAAQAQEAARTFVLPEWTEPQAVQPSTRFKPAPLVGFRTGFLMATDADDAVGFVGIGARFPIADVAAVEVSLDFWADEFANGDAQVFHAPLMVSAMFYFPIEIPTTTPYILAGVGLHSMTFEYSGALAAESDDTESEFGFHGGAGLEMSVGSSLKVHMDVRWILVDPDPSASALRHEKFDTVQFSFGLDFRF